MSTAIAIMAAASLAGSAALTLGLGNAMRPVKTERTSSPAASITFPCQTRRRQRV